MKTYLITLLFVTSIVSLRAQVTAENFKNIYDTATICRYDDTRYKMNDKILKRKQLRALLLSTPESAEEYKAFRKKRRIANVLLITGGALYVSSYFVLPGSFELALGMLGGSVISAVAAIPPGIKSKRHINKAVWLYNRNRLSKVINQ